MIYPLVKNSPEFTKALQTKRILFMFLFLGIPLLIACTKQTEEPPGVGDKANRGYAACNFIIKILEQYNTAEGIYPDSLEELIPDYAPSIPTEVNGQPIVYHKSEDGYSLSFSYIGPGMNICTYLTEGDRQWRCSGAY